MQMKTKNIYSLPVMKEDIQDVRRDSPAHIGPLKNAVDYLIPEGKPILAAADGEVVFVKKNSNIGGPDKKYWNDGNRIVIKHENGEFSAYEHLKYGGVLVKIGQRIKEGAIIGYSGNTGYTFAPHLHFEVFKFTKSNPDTSKDFKCLEIRIKNEDKK
jgi:murein DD-endopeptidase MepM/ murein hydrolase activator NlpD